MVEGYLRPGDLSMVARCTTLRSLHLYPCRTPEVLSAAPLSRLAHLETLALPFHEEVHCLSSLTQLTWLQVLESSRRSYHGPSALQEVSGIYSLRGLSLLGWGGDDCAQLAPLTFLRSLEVHKQGVQYVEGLSALSTLTALTAINFVTEGVSELPGMTNLRRLRVLPMQSEGDDISLQLSKLTGLTHLDSAYSTTSTPNQALHRLFHVTS